MSAESAIRAPSASAKLYVADVLFVYTSQAIAAAFPLLISPFVVRAKGLSVFGEYALLLLTAQTASVISEYSFDAVGPRLVGQLGYHDSPAKTAGAICLDVMSAKATLIPVGLIVGLMIAGATLKRFLSGIEVLATLLVMMGLALQNGWFLIATRQTRVLALSNLFGRGLAAILIVILLVVGRGRAHELFLATAVGTFASGAVAFALNKELAEKRPYFKRNIQLIRQGAPAFGGVAGSATQNLAGQGLVGLALGVADAGVYSAVDRIARTASAVLKPVFLTVYPRFAKLHVTDHNKALRLLSYGIFIWVVFSFLSLAIATFMGPSVLHILYGDKLRGGEILLVALVGWLCLGTLNNILGIQGLLASGQDKAYAVGMWIGLVATLAASALFLAFRREPDSVGVGVVLGELSLTMYFLFHFRNLRSQR